MNRQEMIGRRFGPYEVVRLIGVGGMGSVYLAERVDHQFVRQVAIKVLPPEDANEQAVHRFQSERQTLATLDHPNIVKLLDGGVTEDGLPYFIMDYVEGKPLDEYCDEHALTVDDRLRLFVQLCHAVQYAHRSLVVHRDIKPRNIMVTAQGVPKLLDFGIAKPLRERRLTSRHVDTVTQMFPTFTLQYASPEQFRHGPTTTSVDLYALGVVLYELLTGRWPYAVAARDNDVAIAYAVCETAAERPSDSISRQGEMQSEDDVARLRGTTGEALRKRVRGDLDAIVLKAIAKQPEQRYASAAEFAEDLERHLTMRPVEARAHTPGYLLYRFALRNRPLIAAVNLAVAIALAGVVGVIRQSRIANEQRGIAEKRFADLKSLLGTFLFDVHDTIRDLPGSTQARGMLVEKTSKYLEWLAAEARQDANLQLDLADAYLKLAASEGDPFEMNLGKTAEALGHLEKAERLAGAVLAGGGNNDRAQRYQGLVALGKSNILEQQGKPQQALELTQTALKIFSKRILSHAESSEAHVDVALAHESLADLLTARSDYTAALEHMQEGLEEMRSAWRLDKQNFRANRAIAIYKMKAGNIRQQMGDIDRAASEFQQSNDHLQVLYAESRREDLKRLRAVLLGKLAFLNTEKTDYKGALERYRDQQRLLEELMLIDPNDRRARFDLAACFKNISDMEWALDDMPGSLASAQQSVQLMEKLAAGDAKNAVVQERLARLLIQAADLLVENKKPVEARQAGERGLALLGGLVQRNEASVDAIHAYAESLITCQPVELRNAALGLKFAEDVVARTKGANFAYVDTLAKALAATNNYGRAVEVLEDALQRLPASGKTHLRSVLENHLNQFRGQGRKGS